MIRRDRNHFMNEMLQKLYKDKDILGEEVQLNLNRILLFGWINLAATAGVFLFKHPGFIVPCAILGFIMLVAVLAVPITHIQDRAVEKHDRKQKINLIKSYYIFHYSLIRNSSTYNEYLSQLQESKLNKFHFYLQKYS